MRPQCRKDFVWSLWLWSCQWHNYSSQSLKNWDSYVGLALLEHCSRKGLAAGEYNNSVILSDCQYQPIHYEWEATCGWLDVPSVATELTIGVNQESGNETLSDFALLAKEPHLHSFLLQIVHPKWYILFGSFIAITDSNKFTSYTPHLELDHFLMHQWCA
jgi:hypothetical protein